MNLYQFALKLPEIIGALQDNALDPERQRLLEERFLSDLKVRHYRYTSNMSQIHMSITSTGTA